MNAVRSQNEDAEVIASILAGNTHLFHDLVRPYEHTIYAMAMAMVRNQEDAEDITQEVFLKALRNLGSWRAEAKFGTWLVSIALNEARRRLRRASILKMESIDAPDEHEEKVAPQPLRDWREVPLEALERLEIRRMLQDAVSELPLIYREVFLLRDVEELNIQETSEALGITVASVKVRLHRARIMLQKRLAPQLKQVHPKRRWFPW